MVSLSPQRVLYAAAIVLIPISFGVKETLGLTYWLDPTLILAFLIFLLWPEKPRPLITIAISIFAVFSAYAGTFYMPPIFGDFLTLYHIFKEPLRLFLVLTLFWISVRFFVRDRKFALRWVSISVLIQVVMAIYLVGAVLGKAPYPNFLDNYVNAHMEVQWITVGSFLIPRLCGTFYESPPLGMFMMCCLVILAFGRLRDGVKGRIITFGIIAASIGVAWSLSEQVLLGLLPLCAGAILAMRRGKTTLRIALAAAILVTVPFVSTKLMNKVQQEQQVQGQAVVGTSGGERAFHSRYALRMLGNNPWGWLTGLGPGRYGAYASRTGFFPDSVTPQVTPIAWLFGYGAFGTAIICAWLFLIAKNSVKSYGIFLGLGAFIAILLANMFQAGWKDESFFLALAYLYASAYFKRPSAAWPKRQTILATKRPQMAGAFRGQPSLAPHRFKEGVR